jgi:site-specific DNA-cytosine methylase
MLRHLDLFSGIGGFTLAARAVGGIQTTQFVEINIDAQLILKHHFPGVPIHADIRDYQPEPGEFDLLSMGFPCTGTSNAGSRTGLSHPESALWREGLRCLILAQPKFCIIEQPEGVIRRGLRAILGGLHLAGYSTEIGYVSAAELGAGHQRLRLFIISYPDEWTNQFQNAPSVESSISIPCVVKQPKHPEVRGIIRKDEGDRFLVDVSDELITISKLFVYPDFSKTVGQIEKNPSKNKSPSKNRRRKGEGNGSIYWRTITKNGKDYPQAYYHWKKNGRKRSKYIPKHLLLTIQSADNQKRSIAEILSLLGEKNINPSKTSDTLRVDEPEELDDEVIDNCEISPSKIESPSKSQRKRGEGSGSIHCKPIKRSGKEYKQYWYHYEEWRSGDRLTKKSRYIPKRLLARVEKLEGSKAPVREILEVLGFER